MCLPARAVAQVLERPTRASERSERDEWRRLTFGVTTLGSWDDNLTAEQAAFDPDVPAQSGYTGFADGSLLFEQGGQSQSFNTSGRGYVNTFRNVGLGPQFGADIQAQFVRTFGVRHRLEAKQELRDEPFYSIGAFSGLRQGVAVEPLPDANPLNGVENRRSWAAGSRIALTSQWSLRNAVAASYGYDARQFRDRIGDTRTHNALLSYNRTVGRRSILKFTYGYTEAEFRELTGWIPADMHVGEAGVNLERRFSATRRLVVGFGGGAVQARTLDRRTRDRYEVLAPAGFSMVRFDWARSWSTSVDYRRSVGTLDGLSAQAFTTDAVVVRVGGLVSRRAEATFAASYSGGRFDRQAASFDTYAGTSQLRLMLTQDWSALISHSYNRYTLRNVDLLFPGLPSAFDRNALRVGLTLNVRVIGREPRRPRDRVPEGNDASR